MTRVLGLDIGGSTTRGRIAAGGETVAEASAGSASLTAAGRADATAALSQVISELRGAAPGPLDAVCAGAAGSEIGGGARWLARWLEQTLRAGTGAPRVAVVADVALLLPAAGHRDGLAVVCGTGSVVHGRHGERTARAGGWGYLLGDEGGGYRLVIEALRTELGRRDRGEPPGPLRAALAADGDLDGVVAELHADPRPQRWAARAPALLAGGDPALAGILARGAAGLAGHAASVAARLGLERAPIVLAGGLLAAPAAEAALREALDAVLGGWSVSRLVAPPVAGAVALAQRAAGDISSSGRA